MAGALAIIPKVAGFIAMIRLFGGNELSTGFASMAVPMLLVAAAITMTVGNCAGLVQASGRGFLAYSSVSHSGYLCWHSPQYWPKAVLQRCYLIYLMVYAAMTVGLVSVMVGVEQASVHKGDIELSHLNSLHSRHRWLAAGAAYAF